MQSCQDNILDYSEEVVKLLGYIEERDDLIFDEEKKLLDAQKRGRELKEQLAKLESQK